MADSGFPRHGGGGGATTTKWDVKTYYFGHFPKNCMKLKKKSTRGESLKGSFNPPMIVMILYLWHETRFTEMNT